MKNIEKRKRVMARSMRLGHCICDPKQACPCPTLREHDVCPCAGERLEKKQDGPVRLSRMVDKAGCASKIDQAALRAVLAGLPAIDDPKVLVGMPAADDAGVYQLSDDVALVQTVDVFTPSVDDPYTFGQIAAANSVSDVYAMGGRPISALSIIGFPIREAPDEVLHTILRGGIDKMAEAGVAVVGGHSMNDKEIKAGFAVTGLIDPKRVATNAAARPGDVLVLTKPIGTGIIAFASQIDRAPAGAAEAIAASMASLNKAASERMGDFDAHACTDVTGFGLMGHLTTLAASSGVDVEVVWDDIPLFDGVLACIAQGVLPGAMERNKESVGDRVVMGEGTQPLMFDVCCDAQTSGGLLIALPQARAGAFLERLGAEGVAAAAVIGRVTAEGPGRVRLMTRGERAIREESSCRSSKAAPSVADETSCCSSGGAAEAAASSCCSDGAAKQEAPEPSEACCSGQATSSEACCAGEAEGAAAPASGVAGIQESFQAFMKRAGAPGALDAATKQSIAIALSVLAKCEPCLKAHLKKARSMGFTQEEIDEAAWMAISFGGSPTMMFYNGLRRTGSS